MSHDSAPAGAILRLLSRRTRPSKTKLITPTDCCAFAFGGSSEGNSFTPSIAQRSVPPLATGAVVAGTVVAAVVATGAGVGAVVAGVGVWAPVPGATVGGIEVAGL